LLSFFAVLAFLLCFPSLLSFLAFLLRFPSLLFFLFAFPSLLFLTLPFGLGLVRTLRCAGDGVLFVLSCFFPTGMGVKQRHGQRRHEESRESAWWRI
jgi:hypothetical protein